MYCVVTNFLGYVDHFAFPDDIPEEEHWEYSSQTEVKAWHAASRAVLTQRDDLQPPNSM